MSGTENKKPVIGFGFNFPFGDEEQTLHRRYHGDTNGLPRVKGRDELVATIATVIARNFDPSCRLGVVVRKEDWRIRCNVDFYQHDDRMSGYVFLYDGFGDDERKELERGASIVIDALRHWHPDVMFANCVDEVTAETGKGAFFAINGKPKTAIASEPAPNGIPAEIDRLRERIRILETDVERALSSIAELSTGGAAWKRPEKAAEPDWQKVFGVDWVAPKRGFLHPVDEANAFSAAIKQGWTTENAPQKRAERHNDPKLIEHYDILMDTLDEDRFQRAETDRTKIGRALYRDELLAYLSGHHVRHQDAANLYRDLIFELMNKGVIS